jgi:hypothetical protein
MIPSPPGRIHRDSVDPPSADQSQPSTLDTRAAPGVAPRVGLLARQQTTGQDLRDLEAAVRQAQRAAELQARALGSGRPRRRRRRPVTRTPRPLTRAEVAELAGVVPAVLTEAICYVADGREGGGR